MLLCEKGNRQCRLATSPVNGFNLPMRYTNCNSGTNVMGKTIHCFEIEDKACSMRWHFKGRNSFSVLSLLELLLQWWTIMTKSKFGKERFIWLTFHKSQSTEGRQVLCCSSNSSAPLLFLLDTWCNPGGSFLLFFPSLRFSKFSKFKSINLFLRFKFFLVLLITVDKIQKLRSVS